MARYGSARTARHARRRVLLGALLIVAAGVLIGLGARWLWRTTSLAWQVDRGLELLATASTPAAIRQALETWEQETPPRRRGRAFVEYVAARRDLADPRVRWLLTRITNADFGARSKDWQRWLDERAALAEGRQPRSPRSRGILLRRRWQAPVGLTAWFTTILPVDGTIYVASLGTAFGEADDPAEGVVRVQGVTGEAEFLFKPPAAHLGPGDIVGLALADDGLFAGSFNGYVYAVDGQGRALWSTHVGAPIVAPPLAIDFNADQVTDVAVVTQAGQVVALSGRTGRTAWVARVAGAVPVATDAIGAALAAGDLRGEGASEILVSTVAGQLAVLDLRDGRIRGQADVAAGTLAGPICRGALSPVGPPAFVADRAAQVWAVLPVEGGLRTVMSEALARVRPEAVIAGLRTLAVGDDAPPALIACPTGDYASRRGAVCAVDLDGVRWRVPVDGAVWGTPAVADLNGDGRAEIVVASIAPHPAHGAVGLLTILSDDGRYLWREVLPGAIEASPVVADVDGDNLLDILVADQSGVLHCFAVSGYGEVEWGLHAGDPHNTRNAAHAYEYGQRPFGLQEQWRPK